MGIPETKQTLRDEGHVHLQDLHAATHNIDLLVVDVAATFHGYFILELESIKQFYLGEVFHFERAIEKMLKVIEKLESLKIPIIFSFDGTTELKATTVMIRHRGPRFLDNIKNKLEHIKNDVTLGRFYIMPLIHTCMKIY
jgi:hypothetical protein